MPENMQRAGIETVYAILKQWTVSWVNFVHERFRDKESSSHRRQRHLLLDLSEQVEAVPVAKVGDLTPRLAKEYAARTARTLMRDLHELEAGGLVERTDEGVRAKREMILAFLPWRKRVGSVTK